MDHDTPHTTITADLYRHITRALSLEWSLASANLPIRARELLREPGFALHTHDSFLGQWVGRPVREIRIRQQLVTEHPWYAVVDVLRHEMAHQLADELFAESDATSHGENFHKACRLLGANPAASGTYPTLDESVLDDAISENDRLMLKIRKLLALAESPNRHEAERAMAKARQLMAKHNLAPDQPHTQPYVSIRLGKPRLRHSLDHHALACLVRDACFVKTVWVPTAILDKQRIGRVLEISGTAEHVQMAHYVFDFINRVVEVEWKRYRKGKRLGRNGRRDFALGVIGGFREILDKQTETSPEVRAVVRRGDPGLETYVAQRYPRTRRTRAGRSITVNPDLIDHGRKTARRVGFQPGIDAARRQETRRLEN